MRPISHRNSLNYFHSLHQEAKYLHQLLGGNWLLYDIRIYIYIDYIATVSLDNLATEVFRHTSSATQSVHNPQDQTVSGRTKEHWQHPAVFRTFLLNQTSHGTNTWWISRLVLFVRHSLKFGQILMSVRSTAQPLCCSQAVVLFPVILTIIIGFRRCSGRYQELVSSSFAADGSANGFSAHWLSG